MNPASVADAEALASQLVEAIGGIDGVTRVACPPFVTLPAVAEVLSGSGVGVGAQNAHPEAKGAFTGEVRRALHVRYRRSLGAAATLRRDGRVREREGRRRARCGTDAHPLCRRNAGRA